MPMQGDVKRFLCKVFSPGPEQNLGLKTVTHAIRPQKKCSGVGYCDSTKRRVKEKSKLESNHMTKWLLSQLPYSVRSSTAAPTTVYRPMQQPHKKFMDRLKHIVLYVSLF